MSRDTKIMAASAGLQIIIAAAKAKATTPDAFLEAAKTELVPLLMNIAGLYLLLKFVK